MTQRTSILLHHKEGEREGAKVKLQTTNLLFDNEGIFTIILLKSRPAYRPLISDKCQNVYMLTGQATLVGPYL